MVAVAGGQTGSSTYSSAVELFDYTTQKWDSHNGLMLGSKDGLSIARAQHLTVALPAGPYGNGRFVLLGGKTTGCQSGCSAGVFPGGTAVEVYDTLVQNDDGSVGAVVPTTNALFKTEARTYSGSNLKAGMLPGGKMLLYPESFNGITNGSTTEIYDPANTDALTVGPAMTIGQGGTSNGVMVINTAWDQNNINPVGGDVMLIGGSQSDATTQIYRAQ
jgi:hypothetical protein